MMNDDGRAEDSLASLSSLPLVFSLLCMHSCMSQVVAHLHC